MADQEKYGAGVGVASSPARSREEITPDMSAVSLDKDVAVGVVGEHAQEIDPVLEAKVVRKIDWFLMPAMVLGYGLVYYDKAILGSAALFGMTKDLSLSVVDTSTTPPTTDTSRLSWATSLFYFGMLAGLYPMTFTLQRFNLGRILGGVVILWGGICMATAGVTSHQGLYVQRFFLGFVESIIPTGFMVIVSGYYTQKEQALRQSWWFSATGLFTVIGSALNYGFAQITSGSLKRWQYIYLLAGSLTILFGIWCFILPNSAATAWFLTPSERVIAIERLRAGQTGVRCQKLKMSQIREAFTDIKLYLVFIMMGCAYTVNGAVSGFGPLIVSTFGYNTLESILFQFPVGFVAFAGILAAGYASSKIHNARIILLVLCCLPVIAGCVMIWKSSWSQRPVTPVAGYSIIGFFGPVVSLTITLGMSNVAGATKKSCMAAAIFVAYAVGNIVGPQMVKSQTKSAHYPELWTGLIIFYVITIAASGALWVVLWRENGRRERLLSKKSEGEREAERERLAFRDLTDGENLYFRYVL